MKKILIKLIIGSLLIFIISSCTKNFEALNTPPASSVNIDPGIVLSDIMKNAAFIQGREITNIQFGSWVQHWASGNVGIAKTSRYIQQPDDNTWNYHYALIRNLAQIRNKLLAGEEMDPSGRSKLAIARIVEVCVWERLTDLYGDIPYSESAQPEASINSQPKYDQQKDIYSDLIKQLDKAMTQITDGDLSYGKADLYYQGNFNKWRKFANSLKLQLGMRLKYADPVLAKKTVTEAMGTALISGSDETAAVTTLLDDPVNYNPVLEQYSEGSPDLGYLAKALVDTLLNHNDPRLTLIVAPTANSGSANPVYKGINVALTDNELAGIIRSDYSTPSLKTYFNLEIPSTIPCYVLTYADVCFYKAEAALEGWGATSSQSEGFYQDGIRSAMAMHPYRIADIPIAYTDAQFSFNGLSKEEKLNKIMTQKWIQLFGRSHDAYIEWRRTGYPVLKPGSNAGSTNGTIPRRTTYPSEEKILNNKNYLDALGRLSNGDSYTSKIWIDRN